MASRRTPNRRRIGRPPALTPDTRNRLLTAISNGTPVTQATVYAGIHYATFRRWMIRGEIEQTRHDEGQPPNPDEEPFRDLREAVIRARADVAVRNVGLVQKAAIGGYTVEETTRTYVDDRGRKVTETTVKKAPLEWRAAKWLLETSFREDFSRTQHVEVSGVTTPGEAAGAAAGPSEAAVVSLAARLGEHRRQLDAGRSSRRGDEDVPDESWTGLEDEEDIIDGEVLDETG